MKTAHRVNVRRFFHMVLDMVKGMSDDFTYTEDHVMFLLKKYNVDAMSCIKAVEKLIGKDLGIDESEIEAVRFEDFNGVA